MVPISPFGSVSHVPLRCGCEALGLISIPKLTQGFS
jgi:hypothetical protein